LVFGLVLGEDTATDLLQGKWKHSADLLLSMQLHVFLRATGGHLTVAREDDNTDAQEALLSQCTELTCTQMLAMKRPVLHVVQLGAPLSSTLIRQLLGDVGGTSRGGADSTGSKQLRDALPLPVLEYILRNRLYGGQKAG